jgi:hypothetical protein
VKQGANGDYGEIMTKKPKHYAHPAKLIEVYRFIEKFREDNLDSPTFQDVIDAGLAGSTSVVRYYFDYMEKYNMVKFTMKNGRRKTIHLQPLGGADPFILQALSEEK